ncbi:peptidylglycine alpha-hydroxylating monooxygenase [Anoplophora glabripennis]|nr:peptidylglycine alpha-hydroxylating monooxygenase [Anoplophora glabripennis]
MSCTHMLCLPVVVLFLFIFHLTCCEVKKFPLLMPNVYPNRDELYLCTPVRVVDDKSFYIVGFEPNATMNVAHHMLLFGCTTPGTTDEYWDCGEMAVAETDSNLKKASPCAEGSHVLYAWARNAKTLELPEDVGFQVGMGTAIQYIVLQIHYSKKFPDKVTDNSGLFLMYTEERQNKLAGVVLLGVGGSIPPRSVTYMETECLIDEPKTIYPFAYRTHTHSLGRVVSGYSISRDIYGKDHWKLLGKRDPLTAQMFYPVFDTNPIKYGDRLAARCTMDSRERNRVTQVGPTNNDEMCNFYLMYYVENDTPLEMKYCTTEGPPYYHWNNEGNDLNSIPDREASSLD